MDNLLPLNPNTSTAVNGQIQFTNSNGLPPSIQFQKIGDNPGTATIEFNGLTLTSDTKFIAPDLQATSQVVASGNIVTDSDFIYKVGVAPNQVAFSVKDQITTLQSVLQDNDIEIGETQGYISALQIQATQSTNQLGSSVAVPVNSGLQTQITDNLNLLTNLQTTVNEFTTTQGIVNTNQNTTNQGLRTDITTLQNADFQNSTQVGNSITTAINNENLSQYTKTIDLQADYYNKTEIDGKDFQNSTQVGNSITTAINNQDLSQYATNVGVATNYYNKSQIDGKDFQNSTQVGNSITTAINNQDLSQYAKTVDVASSYLTKSDATTVYQTKSDTTTNYYDKSQIDAKDFQNSIQVGNSITTAINNQDLSQYAKVTDVSSTYQTKSDTSTNYLKISDASSVYQTISNMINYYTKTQVDSQINTINNTTNGLQTQINQLLVGDIQYSGKFVDNTYGSDETGTGIASKPFKTIQKVLDTYASSYIIYVQSSTTQNITFNTNNQSIQLVFCDKTQHSGLITLVEGNTSIYFLSPNGTAWLKGGVNDASKGTVYYDLMISGTYTKNPTVSGSVPVGYCQFGPNSQIDGLTINLLSNTMIATYGLGAMGPIEQTNGLLVLQHSGSVNGASPNTSPIHITSPDVAAGQVPITLIQGQIQLLSPYSAYALYCQASYGYLFLASVSTLQADMSSYKNIQAAGSATYITKVWASVDCPPANLALYNPTYANHANNIKADYPTTTNYTLSGADIVSNHLSGIDTKIGTMNTTLSSHTTTLGNHTTSINTLNGQVGTLNTFMAAVPNTYLTKLQADGYYQPLGTYLTQTTGDSRYLQISNAFTKTQADSLYLTITNAQTQYQPIGTYLTQTSGDSRYQQLTGMSSYLTTSNAALLYQPIGSYALSSDLSNYLTTTDATSTYKSISSFNTDIANYYNKTTSDGKYALITSLSSYALASDLTTANTNITNLQNKTSYMTQANNQTVFNPTSGVQVYNSSNPSIQYKDGASRQATFYFDGTTFQIDKSLNSPDLSLTGVSSVKTSITNLTNQMASTSGSPVTSGLQTQISALQTFAGTTVPATYATITSLNTTNTNITNLQTFQGSLTNANLNTSLTAANDFNACHFTYSGTTTSSNQDIFQISNRTTSTNPVLRWNKDFTTNQSITFTGTRLESSGVFYATDIACGGVSSLSTALPSISTRITGINYTSSQTVLNPSSGVQIYNAANPSLYFKDGSTNQGMLQFDGSKFIMDRTLSTQGFMNLGYTQLNHSKYGASSFMCNGFPNNGYSSIGARNSFWGYACCSNANYQDLAADNTCFGANINLGTQGSISFNTCFGSQISTVDNPRGCTYIGSQISGSGATNETVICSGNLGLSGYGNNTTLIKAQSGGIFRSDNSGSFNTTSDQRIKKDIVDNTAYTLEKFMNLRLRDFNYKTIAEEPVLIKNEYPVYPNKETGLIVQEVQSVFPDCVITPSDPTTQPYSIDYHYVSLLNIAATQQVAKKVEQASQEIKPGDIILSYEGQNGSIRNGHLMMKCIGGSFDKDLYPKLYENLGTDLLPTLQCQLPGFAWFIYLN